MTRKLSLLLIAIFLSVQTFSLLHMAEHGFESHKHHGRTCDIYFACEHQKSSNVPPAISVPMNVAFIILTLVGFSQTIRPQRRNYSGEPRAPPVFSL